MPRIFQELDMVKLSSSNPVEFSNKICSYILNRYKNPDDINNLMMIIG